MINLKRITPLPSFNINQAITRSFRKSGKEVNDNIKSKLSTGSRSGRVYIVRGKEHKASAPGEYPAKLTGKVVGGQQYKVTNKQLILGNTAPHSVYLEDGTTKMAPRTFLKPLVESKTGDIEKSLHEEILKELK